MINRNEIGVLFLISFLFYTSQSEIIPIVLPKYVYLFNRVVHRKTIMCQGAVSGNPFARIMCENKDGNQYGNVSRHNMSISVELMLSNALDFTNSIIPQTNCEVASLNIWDQLYNFKNLVVYYL